jgi:hypothetical protein
MFGLEILDRSHKYNLDRAERNVHVPTLKPVMCHRIYLAVFVSVECEIKINVFSSRFFILFYVDKIK